jgi:hypothetical protein
VLPLAPPPERVDSRPEEVGVLRPDLGGVEVLRAARLLAHERSAEIHPRAPSPESSSEEQSCLCVCCTCSFHVVYCSFCLFVAVLFRGVQARGQRVLSVVQHRDLLLGADPATQSAVQDCSKFEPNPWMLFNLIVYSSLRSPQKGFCATQPLEQTLVEGFAKATNLQTTNGPFKITNKQEQTCFVVSSH